MALRRLSIRTSGVVASGAGPLTIVSPGTVSGAKMLDEQAKNANATIAIDDSDVKCI
tara:strand:- start:111 stop:281 length:171 start_codon:yes stop_codon:yes gene_type:complete